MADIETEREMSRAEVAAYLHEFADKLDTTGTDGVTNRNRTADGEAMGDGTHGTDTDTTEADDARDNARTDSTEANDTATTGSNDTGRSETTQRGEQPGRVTFTLGNESATVNPPETIDFDIAVDSTAGMLESSSHETVKFTLRWDAETTDDDGELGLH